MSKDMRPTFRAWLEIEQDNSQVPDAEEEYLTLHRESLGPFNTEGEAYDAVSPSLARNDTGIPEIDTLSVEACRSVLATIYRQAFYDEIDKRWDPDKDLSGADFIGEVCSALPPLAESLSEESTD